MLKPFLLSLFLFLFVACSISGAHAAGFRIYDQGAAAAGQANAFTAQADDPSAIHYNPAGLTQLHGIQLSGGSVLVGGGTSFTSPMGTSVHGGFDGSIASPAPFNFYATANLGDIWRERLRGVVVGLGVTTPFGLVYSYPATSPFATAVTKEKLPMVDIKPTIAYHITEQLSVGLGADIYTFSGLLGSSHAFIQQLISSGGTGLPPAGSQLEVNGTDTAAGFNASLMYTPFRNTEGKPLVNVGFVYRSQVTLHLNGDFLANGTRVTTASTTAVLPQTFTGGIAIWPIRTSAHEWKLELDVDYTDWKAFRNTDVRFGTGAVIPFPQNWRGSYTTMLGTEWKWLQVPSLPAWEVALRGGYWHAQAAVPDRSYNPAVPDADQHLFAVGLGTLCKSGGRFLGVVPCGGQPWFSPKAIGFDVSYQFILYEPRTVIGSQNPVAIPGAIDGTYLTHFHVASLNLRLNF
ncbi:OmpP1/FadL family transporter [Nitrospira sp. Nam74]